MGRRVVSAPQFPTPHRRFNPLTGRWVLVSAHRTERPWQGGTELIRSKPRAQRDPDCYLCPGSVRAGGEVNPQYTKTFVFTNDFPALLHEPGPKLDEASPLFRAERQAGTCRVICFSPRHDLTLAEMDEDSIVRVVDLWASQTEELGQDYRWVQVFENKGTAMGASNPHPHGQIWAGTALPSIITAEDEHQRNYLAEHHRNLLLDYAVAESADGERTISENDEWIITVPYWAVWPFEALILPKRPAQRLSDLDTAQRRALAGALSELLIRYDNLFSTPFPYSLGWHGAPFDGGPTDHWQLHGHAYPPLLRSATIRKFMVGYELLSEAQRDLTPEDAARRLREVPSTHYLSRDG